MVEPETAVGSQSESPFAVPPAPRLSILHLMLWTACTAAYLALIRAVYARQGDLPRHFAAIQDTSSVLYGIIVGAELAGAMVLVTSRIRNGLPILRQPGHWFLIISAIANLISVPVLIAMLLLREADSAGTSFLFVVAATSLFPAIAFAFAARYSNARRWKIIFVGLVVVALAQCFQYLGFAVAAGRFGTWFVTFSAIPSLGRLLLAGAVLVVSLVDLMARRQGDWLHWTGVTTHVTAASVHLLWLVATRLIR